MNVYAHSDSLLLGKTFGQLTVIERVNTHGKAAYKCVCVCGQEIIVIGAQLLHGKTKSCGCLRKSIARKNMETIKDKGYEIRKQMSVDGTNILTHSQKVSKNSTTGIKGVSQIKKTGKYRAYLYLKRKQISLGNFDTLREAQQARLDAEEKYYKPYVDLKKTTRYVLHPKS